MKRKIILLITIITFSLPVFCAGLLSPVNSGKVKPVIKSHSVNISIIANFAKTEVTQTFYNPGNTKIEAIYSFPLPKDASLSEVSVLNGEKRIEGEVVTKEEADRIYGVEKNSGNKTAKAEKNKYQDFKFYVANIAPKSSVVVTFVYYQPLNIDTQIGRYVYPLEAGGTDESARQFWTSDSNVESKIYIKINCKTAYPISTIRTPGNSPVSSIKDLGNGQYSAEYELGSDSLDKDFVFYYRFKDNLPGKLEVIPYKDGKEGNFMAVLTPGIDLKPLTNGSDYIFVLDISGSMDSKIQKLAEGVVKSLRELSAKDRFRIVVFDSEAQELTNGFTPCNMENITHYSEIIKNIETGSSTNLYEGIKKGLSCIENGDRVNTIFLVTDAVANTGILSPVKFKALMQKYDVRIFGFLMGNSSNWPLMRIICDASGGFYSGISNDDDIIGEILKAKNKITHEALHDVEVSFSGVKISGLSNSTYKKVYYGQQLVIFGKYSEGGKAKITMKTRISGKNKVYSTEFTLPNKTTETPEIERLYAVARIKVIEDQMNTLQVSEAKGKEMIKKLGLKYQIVTDETSMIVLSDEKFKEYNIDRKNKRKIQKERKAQSLRKNKPVKNYRVDKSKPMFDFPSPSLGGGGGAMGPFTLIFTLFAAVASFVARRKK